MPTAPPKSHHCGGTVRNGVCDRCGPRARARDKERGHAAARGYDYQWQQFRRRYLAENPLCVDCDEQGIVAAATDIHHVEKLKERPDLKYEPTNLKALCGGCHKKRTARGE